MNTKIKKYNIYKRPMIILLLTMMCIVISVFINLPFTPFDGSIILAGITLTCLMYNIEENRFKSKQIENNVKQLISNEINFSISILNTILEATDGNYIESIPEYLKNSLFKNNVVMWYKLAPDLPKVFKEDELRILQNFYIELKKLEEINPKLDNRNLTLIKDIKSKGEYVLKNIFNKKNV